MGEFKATPEERALNSLEGWQMLMYDDDQIGSLGSDVELQSRHGIRKAGQSKQEFDNEVASVQGQMRLIRNDAKFFLAQCLFDNQNENAAGNWLEVLRDNADDDRWDEGVNYLLGRSLESRKQYDEALAVYGNTKLRQSHGNLIRARMIKQLIALTYGSDEATQQDKSAEAAEKQQPDPGQSADGEPAKAADEGAGDPDK